MGEFVTGQAGYYVHAQNDGIALTRTGLGFRPTITREAVLRALGMALLVERGDYTRLERSHKATGQDYTYFEVYACNAPGYVTCGSVERAWTLTIDFVRVTPQMHTDMVRILKITPEEIEESASNHV